MTPQQQQAASLAWQHAHPLLMVLFSTLGSLVVISIIVLVRWLGSRSAWAYHPGGASGFLKDELVRWGIILVPYLALSITFKLLVYDFHPEWNKPPVWAAFVVCAMAFRILFRRLPAIRAMGRHIDDARAKARAVRAGVPS